MSTRPTAIENVTALVADDIERQVRRMDTNGWAPDAAFEAACAWWAQNGYTAMNLAKEALEDLL